MHTNHRTPLTGRRAKKNRGLAVRVLAILLKIRDQESFQARKASGNGSDPRAHQPDAVEIGLFRVFGLLARLIALVQKFDLLQFVKGFAQLSLSLPRAGFAARRRNGRRFSRRWIAALA